MAISKTDAERLAAALLAQHGMFDSIAALGLPAPSGAAKTQSGKAPTMDDINSSDPATREAARQQILSVLRGQ